MKGNLIWIVLIFCSQVGYAGIHESHFVAEVVKGDIAFMQPSGFKWVPLEIGQTLTSNSLLRMREKSILKLRDKSTGDRPLRFQANGESYFRLNQALIREFNIKEVDIPLDNLDIKSNEKGDDDTTIDFEKAWERASGVFLTASKEVFRRVSSIVLKSQSENSATHYLGQMEITYPLDRGFVVVEAFPHSFPVNWLSEPVSEKYVITWWQKDRENEKKRFVTKSTHRVIHLPNSGQFYIQVEDLKGQNRPHKIMIEAFTPETRGQYIEE